MKKLYTLLLGILPLQTILAQPLNDNCANAIILNVEATCTSQSYSTIDGVGATSQMDGAGYPYPACAGPIYEEVWFKFVAPASGAVMIDSDNIGGISDGGMALYSGTCGNFTLIECNDDYISGGGDLMPRISRMGLNPGETYYIAFWSNGAANNGEFNICATNTLLFSDECTDAISLNVEQSCTFLNYTTLGATSQFGANGYPDPGCAGSQGANEVWFKFTAPAGGAVTIDSDIGEIIDGGMALYSGACGNLTLIECDDDDADNAYMPRITRTDLTSGITYYIAFWKRSGNEGTFKICLSIPPPPPANDDCANATNLIPSIYSNCSSSVSGELTYATASNQANGCNGSADDDVWYSFTATSENHTISLLNTGWTDFYHSVYSGICANLGNPIICSDDNNSTLTNLTIGNEYYIRVYTFSATTGPTVTFNVCVGTISPPPANDNCVNATTLTVGESCTFENFTNAGATNQLGTVGYPNPQCAGSVFKEVWFKFTAPEGGAVILDSDLDVITNGGMALYSGTCGNLSLIECDDNDGNGSMPKIIKSGLTSGEDYYIAFWDYYGNEGTFKICLTIPPANDDCMNAITLNVGESCQFENFPTLNATNQLGIIGYPSPGCAGSNYNEVWFKFVAPASGTVKIATDHYLIMINGGMALYSGTCGNLTLIDCADDSENDVYMPEIITTGLTPQEVYYVAFWKQNGYENANFNICIGPPSGVGISENTRESFFNIFPNPSNAKITVEGEKLKETNLIELRDPLGRVIETFKVNQNNLSIDLSYYSTGIYTLILKGNNFEEIQKIQFIK